MGATTLAFLAMPGCLRRKIRITTDPPGAAVSLNLQEIGRTPAEADFTFYGRYDIRLDREGYEPVTTARTAHAPPWEWPIIDLFFEILPVPINHTVHWHFDLEETPTPGTPEGQQLEARMLEDARELKDRTDGGDW